MGTVVDAVANAGPLVVGLVNVYPIPADQQSAFFHIGGDVYPGDPGICRDTICTSYM